jgi:hypothetical protein
MDVIADFGLASVVRAFAAFEAERQYLERKVAPLQRKAPRHLNPAADGRRERFGLVIGVFRFDRDDVNGNDPGARRLSVRSGRGKDERSSEKDRRGETPHGRSFDCKRIRFTASSGADRRSTQPSSTLLHIARRIRSF